MDSGPDLDHSEKLILLSLGLTQPTSQISFKSVHNVLSRAGKIQTYILNCIFFFFYTGKNVASSNFMVEVNIVWTFKGEWETKIMP